MSDDETEFATVTVTVERDINVPVSQLEDDVDAGTQRERAADWFWNIWDRMLAGLSAPDKEDVTVTSVTLPWEGDDDE